MVYLRLDGDLTAKASLERWRGPATPPWHTEISLSSLDDCCAGLGLDNVVRRRLEGLEGLEGLEEGGVAGITRLCLVPSKDRAITMFCVFLNTASTVALVFMNKIILSDPQLRNMQVSFAMWHFACTAAVLWIACHRPFHLFQPVRLPVVKMMPLCSFFAGFLILNNLSLAFNSVGFYQLAKIMTTPCVVLFNFILFRKTISSEAGLSLISLCFGVALTNRGAAGSNPLGAAIAVAAFTTTAVYQIWIGREIKDFGVASPQLLMNQAPISVFLLAFFVPIFDTIPDLRFVSSNILATLFFSGLVASLLNLSQFLIIGRTSPLTFNVASHLKTVIILTLGWIIDGKIPMTQDFIGIVFALGGAMVYSMRL